MAAIKKRSLVDQVYERLRNDIITLRLPLGSRVNVNELQDALGVSCTPIREAINRLQQEGLIAYENNVGARVLTLEPKDVEEIMQLATTLHCAAARLALARENPQVLAGQIRERMEELKGAQTPQAMVTSVHKLVAVFYQHCGNRRLDHSMLNIQGQQLLLRHIYANLGREVQANLDDFHHLLEGVEAGDAERVCQALSDNGHRLTQAVSASLS